MRVKDVDKVQKRFEEFDGLGKGGWRETVVVLSSLIVVKTYSRPRDSGLRFSRSTSLGSLCMVLNNVLFLG